MKYRKKPAVIEAFQFHGQSNLSAEVPDWFTDAVLSGVVKAEPDTLLISTLEGQMYATLGDYIIKGLKGELYPCTPDIFQASYELC